MGAALRDDRAGFVVAVVVFILFAVGLAGTAAYQVVRIEAELSAQGREANVAHAAAVGGMERLLGAHYGIPPDSETFSVGEGTAIVTTRKIAAVDSVTDLYHLRSEGLVVDPRWADAPARRIVHRYALLHKDPVGIHAAVLVASPNLRLRSGARVEGEDAATPGECAVAGLYDKAGIANTTGVYATLGGGSVSGTPPAYDAGDAAAVLDSADVRWDVLQSASFSVEYDVGAGSPPDWDQLPEAYPVVRVTEDLSGGVSWSHQGVLIVPGTFTAQADFTWDGIILAGTIGNIARARIEGLLVGGLDGNQASFEMTVAARVRYHSCHAMAASESLAYFEPLSNTWFEGG